MIGFQITSKYYAIKAIFIVAVSVTIIHVLISGNRIDSSNALNVNTNVSSTKIEDHISINQYRENRNDKFDSWFKNGIGKGVLLEDADKDGPILDFIIAGFPKCGTTSMMSNLARIAPMPGAKDICTPVHQTTFYAYKNWPKQYGEDKVLRGSKCPQYITNIEEFSKYLPRTKIIIGIRHPVLWFQSFWNMLKSNGAYRDGTTPYNKTAQCNSFRQCYNKNGCTGRNLFCVNRGRFHIKLAQLGKTALGIEERKLLAPNDVDGGGNVRNQHIRNHVFLYEQSDLKKDYIWDELADFLDVPKFRHDREFGIRNKTVESYEDFCVEKYDNFRAIMMPYAYDLSVWLQEYFIPVARNESSSVTIPNIDMFTNLVEKYKKDPCGRLYRSNNGTYIFNTRRTNI